MFSVEHAEYEEAGAHPSGEKSSYGSLSFFKIIGYWLLLLLFHFLRKDILRIFLSVLCRV